MTDYLVHSLFLVCLLLGGLAQMFKPELANQWFLIGITVIIIDMLWSVSEILFKIYKNAKENV